MSGDAEVTLEANPEDVSAGRGAGWTSRGSDRFPSACSRFRMPSFRRSAAGTTPPGRARRTLLTRSRALSVSGDLILGLPCQTAESFARASGAREAAIEHVSVYLLKAEKPGSWKKTGGLRPERYLGDDARRTCGWKWGRLWASGAFVITRYQLGAPGCESRHNMKYWTADAHARPGRRPPTSTGRSVAGRTSPASRLTSPAPRGRRPRRARHAGRQRRGRREAVYLGLRLSERRSAGARSQALVVGVPTTNACPDRLRGLVRRRASSSARASACDSRNGYTSSSNKVVEPIR